MPKNSLNVSLKGADDIFSTEESRQEQQREQVQQIPIGELFPFKNHPFKVSTLHSLPGWKPCRSLSATWMMMPQFCSWWIAISSVRASCPVKGLSPTK